MSETFPVGTDGSVPRDIPDPPKPPTATDVLKTAIEQAVANLTRQLEWYRHHPFVAIVCAVVGFGVAWVANAAILALKYDGYVVPPGSAAAGEGNRLWGGIFWLLLPGLLAACAVFVVRVGPRQALAQLKGMPATFKGAARMDRHALPHVLGGFAVGGAISVVSVPLVSGAAAGWLVFALVTRLRNVVVSLVSALWRLVAERLGGSADNVGPQSSLLAVAGTTAALLVAWLVGSNLLVLVAAAIAGALAIALTRATAPKPTPASTTAVFIVLGLAAPVAVAILTGTPAFADDGGYPECGRPGFLGWVTDCPGSTKLLWTSLLGGGIPGFIGGLFGGGAGAGGGEEPPPFIPGTGCNAPPGNTPMNQERADLLKWRAAHPDAPASDYWDYKQRVEEFRQWQQEPDDPFYTRWMRDLGRYNTEVRNALYEDYDSGNMQDRILRMPKHIVPSLINAGGSLLKGLYQQARDMQEAGGPMMYPLKMAKDSFGLMMRQAEMLTEIEAMQQRGASPQEIRAWSRDRVEELAPGMLPTVEKYIEASLKNDNETTAQMTTQLFAHIEVMAISGRGQTVLTERALLANAARMEQAALTRAQAAGATRLPDPTAPPRTRQELLNMADEHGSVRFSPQEADALGLEAQLADDLWDHHMRWGGSTEFKLGAAENVAMRQSGSYQPKPGCYVGPDGAEAPSLLVKSISETDMKINPSLAGKERVVSFVDGAEPPAGTPEWSRWKWRQQERTDLKASMEELATKGGIKIDQNGKPVPYWVDEMPDGTLVDRTTGKLFVPDNDTYTGNPGSLTPEQYQSSLYKLGRGTIQHPGDTPNWHIPLDDPDFAYKVKVKNKVIADVEKEGRIRIDADGPRFCKTLPKPSTTPPGYTAPLGTATSGVLQAQGGGAPLGYDSPAPGSNQAPPGYDGPAPGANVTPPGYDN